MAVSVGPPAVRSVSSRAMGQCTILMHRPGGLTTADAAAVTAYVPGTTTPYPGPLYGDPDTATPLVFPVAVGEDGVVALWADAPARLELEAVHAVLGRGRVVLDLEPEPSTVAGAGDAYSKAESDARYEPRDSAYTKSEADARYLQAPLTEAQVPAAFLTQTEGDARYALSGSGVDAWTKAEADTRYLQLVAGGTVTGAVTFTGGATHTLRLTVAGGAQPKITVAASAPGSPATGDLWVW